MQQNLFGLTDEKSQQKKGLVIIKQGRQELTKQQKDFNKLVKKIEKLRGDIEKITLKLDSDLKYYAEQIHPLELQLVEIKIAGAKIFYRFYTDKKSISKNERKLLKELIASLLDDILFLMPGEPDDELKSMYQAVNDESYEETKLNAFDEMKQEMQDQFRDSGIDIDLDGINADMTEEEIAVKMKEMHDALAARAEEMQGKNSTRKKTKKQQEREAREKQIEEARKKNIGSIYKQLAKAFHPDLESDPELKVQKEGIMKQLTVAYESNDLHTLLKLEIELMQKESNDPARLTNDKLSVYNEVLKEQVVELEMQLGMTMQHPRYHQLQRFANYPGQLQSLNLVKERKETEQIITSLKRDEQQLKGPDALQRLKAILKAFKQDSQVQDNVDAMMQDLMEKMMGR